MTAILFSRDWYRLANIKPQLRSHVEVHVHSYRGRRWYLLQNHSTGHIKRLSPEAYLLVGLMNGQRTLDDIWQLSSERLGEKLPTHEEVLQLVGGLYQNSIIKMDLPGDAGELFRSGHEQRQKRWLAKLKSPLSLQIPLFDPNNFLNKTQAWVTPIFHWVFACIWLALISVLLVLSWQNWSALTTNVADQILAADNLFLLWVLYPIVKVLHEFGHAYAIKRNGGQVHEVGVMFLVFFPMPYVDASASSAFASKYQRMLVDSAGMLVELFIAALAMLVWVNAETGLARSIAYNIIFIAGVSTILFNGNPLLRFDGYYLLADWLELPNLAQRSNQYWGYLCKRYLFSLKRLESPADTSRESFIFTVYGVASLFYRLFISITIVLFVATQFFFVGVVLGIWSLVTVWVWPLLKMGWKVYSDNELSTGGRNRFVVVSLMFLVVALLLFAIPLPRTTSLEAVALSHDEGRVVTRENCYQQQWLVGHNQPLNVGQSVLACTNKTLTTEYAVTAAMLQEAMARRQSAYQDPVKMAVLDHEINELNARALDLQQRVEDLQLTTKSDGAVYLPRAADMTQTWLKRGHTVAYVINDKSLSLYAMLPEHLVDQVRGDSQQAYLRLQPNATGQTVLSNWHIYPASSRNVISPVLTEAAGGTIALDPADQNKTLQNYFVIEATAKEGVLKQVNQRVFIQFVHSSEPIAYRTYRYIRRTFLEYFDV